MIMQDLLSSKTLAGNLVYITLNLGRISRSGFQSCLETAELPLCDALENIKQTEDDLKWVKGQVANRISQNWKSAVVL